MVKINKHINNKTIPPSDEGKGMRKVRPLVPKSGMEPAQATDKGLVTE